MSTGTAAPSGLITSRRSSDTLLNASSKSSDIRSLSRRPLSVSTFVQVSSNVTDVPSAS